MRLRMPIAGATLAKMRFDFCRKQAKAFAATGHFAIAADYTIRALNLRSRDREMLDLGAALGSAVGQDGLTEACNNAMARLSYTATVSPLDQQPYERLTSLSDDPAPVNEILAASNTTAVKCKLINGFGRGLVTTRAFAKGEPIVVDRPLFCARRSPQYCSQCLAPLPSVPSGAAGDLHEAGTTAGPVRCELSTSCSETYCSAACRDEAAREGHDRVCGVPAYQAFVASLREDLAGPDKANASVALTMLVVLQILQRAQALQDHPLSQNGIEELSGAITYEPSCTLEVTGAVAAQMSQIFPRNDVYLEDLLTLMAKVQTNEFVSPAGSAVYRVVSMINHSCVPNAVVDQGAGGFAVVSAAAPINAGQQLLIDYTANAGAKLDHTARQRLCAQRHFECFCSRCVRRM